MAKTENKTLIILVFAIAVIKTSDYVAQNISIEATEV